MQFLEDLHLRSGADTDRRCRPLPDAIDGQDRRVIEGGREEGAGCMALVVLRVEDVAVKWALALLLGPESPDRRAELPVREELLLHPEGTGLQEASESAGCDRQIRLQDSVELEERLIIERNRAELI